jgi:acetyl-CoA C-acetyltransferase
VVAKMFDERVAIVEPVRTAIGRFGGSLAGVSALDLGAHVVRETIRRADLDPEQVERVVAGENLQVTAGGNPARHVLLRAGLPIEADAYSINMNCSSGLRAMTSLAQDILMGDVGTGVAVGMENMSASPYLLEGARFGYRLGSGTLIDFLADYILGDAGPMAENVAAEYHITRQEQDEFAAESQLRAARAADDGLFKEQITGVEVAAKGGPVVFDTDEHPRRDVTAAQLARLKPAFAPDGSVTAGNSSGINDGAAALVLMPESQAGQSAAAYLRGWASAGVEPGMFGIGPVPAVRRLLDRAGLELGDIGLIELNEAFASSTLAVIRDLKLDPAIVNVNGGAIALGHPVGATGLVLVTKLINEMRRRGVQYGLVTMCVGSGQGMAALFELE